MNLDQLDVMIVDDERTIRNSLAAYLEDLDLEVTQMGSAEEALTLMDQRHFHVVIVDLRLPGISGDMMIRKAREISPQTRFLIHTGSVDYRLSPELLALGVRPEHILSKPLPKLEILLDAVQKLARELLDGH